MGRTSGNRNKERQFKLAARRRMNAARHDAAEIATLREEAASRGLRLVSFEITREAMPDPLVDALPEADRAEIERITRSVLSNPKEHQAALEALVERHPHIPTLWNWLMSSVAAAGDDDRADQLSGDIYRRFPDYLFGVAQWIVTLLQRGDVAEATHILNGRMSLPAFFPDRRTFHATEYVTFNGMLGSYFAATGEFEMAMKHYEMIEEVLPDHPAVRYLEDTLLREAISRVRDDINGDNLPEIVTRPHPITNAAGR